MSEPGPACPVCGEFYDEHIGLHGLCQERRELKAALRNLVGECYHLTPCGDDLIFDCCEASAVNGHRKDCSFMTAIAEAERLLGDQK